MTTHRLSPAVERLATLCGAVADSFEKGTELLQETAGVRLSESTVERTTETTGQRIAEHVQKGRTFGGKEPWNWFRDACGRTVGYIEIDATGVRQQGSRGEAAEGRMAYVGMIANPLPDRERVFEGLPKPGQAMQARYTSGLYPLAEMGPLLRRQGAQVGLDRAEVWVAITDGGAGVGGLRAIELPACRSGDLGLLSRGGVSGEVGSGVAPDRRGRGALAQTKSWSRLLRDEGGDAMIAVLENWEWPSVKGLAAVRADVLSYFRNHVDRMDYPNYEAAGWYIGSGAVESACKTVVGQRLKGSGMRWSEAGAHAVCHVRALYRSEHSQWTDFWRRSTAA